MVYNKIKKTRHSVYNINYHFVWIPKYRRKIFKNNLAIALNKILWHISFDYNFDIKNLSIMPDHIHMLVSAPPKLSPSRIISVFKSLSAKELYRRYPDCFRKIFPKQIWTNSYYVGTCGNVSQETINKYIGGQTA